MRVGVFANWQDSESYAYLKKADRTGLMWEWLRRDPAYLAWHAKASLLTGGHSSEPLNWGLHFRGRAGPGLSLGPDNLACPS
ncbi:transcriptional regulator domain-containing protein [Novosphingobium aerophilum]|uniref:transcriptional regulator domain-containing protein n=1 Tax=Novosphingobium aerophilum TaxID=2839843 RepID=UPI003FD58EE5